MPLGATLLPLRATPMPPGATLLPPWATTLHLRASPLPFGATLLPPWATLLPPWATLLSAHHDGTDADWPGDAHRGSSALQAAVMQIGDRTNSAKFYPGNSLS